MAENLSRALRLVEELRKHNLHYLPKQAVPTVTQVHAEPGEASPGGNEASEVPTAFISWAHANSGWFDAEVTAWESQVAAFAHTLCRLGVDTEVDLFRLDESVDWTRYGPQQIEVNSFTLVVVSRGWAERWSGRNTATVGAGAAAEADTLRGLFSRNQETWQNRVIVVQFPEVDTSEVPPDLQRAPRVSVDPHDVGTYESLLRLVTKQPRYPKPSVGRIPKFRPNAGYEDTDAEELQVRLSEIQKRQQDLRGRKGRGATEERRNLHQREAATRGFIDAELSMDDD